MPEILIVEDNQASALKLKNRLVWRGFTEPEWFITIWHVDGPDVYRQSLKDVRTTKADVLIADLGLVSPNSRGHDDATILATAREVANAEGIGSDDPTFWDWEGDYSFILTGALLVQLFVNCAEKQKSVCISSNLEPTAARWYKRLKYGAIGFPTMMNPDTQDQIADFINNRYQGWEVQLWNDDTKTWFRRGTVNHSPVHPEQEPRAYQNQQDRVKQLLIKVLGVDPPQHWFEPDSFVCLYESLLGLTGYHSCANGHSKEYNVCVQNLIILLGIAMRDKLVPEETRKAVLRKVTFTGHPARLVPCQQEQTARGTISDIVHKCFGDFVWYKEKERKADGFLILNVNMTDSAFEITLNFDPYIPWPNKEKNFSQKAVDLEQTGVGLLSRQATLQDFPEGCYDRVPLSIVSVVRTSEFKVKLTIASAGV